MRGLVAEEFRADLRAFLSKHLDLEARRVAYAAKARRGHSDRKREAVRLAADGLLDRRMLLSYAVEIVVNRIAREPERYGLAKAVGRRTVRDELKKAGTFILKVPSSSDRMGPSNGR